jgi:hypothetical protein
MFQQPDHGRSRKMAPTTLGGPPHAPGNIQEALLGSMEPTKTTGAISIITMAKGDQPTTEVHPYHSCASLGTGSVIRQCYFILLLFQEWHEVGIK